MPAARHPSAYLLTMALCAGMLTSCDLEGLRNSLDDFVLIIALDSIQTVVVGQVLDARTGELLAAEATLTFSGPGRDRLIDLYSDPITRQVVEGGLVSFGVDDTAVPTAEHPVVFDVLAEAEGYQPGFASVQVTSEGSYSFTIRLLDLKNAPYGVSGVSVERVEGDAQGYVAGPHHLATSPDLRDGTRASVSLPAGTGVRDAEGELLPAPLHATLVSFDHRSLTALQYHPTAFTPFPVSEAPGGGRAFVTAGFVHVSVFSAEGPRGRALTQPVPCTIELPAGTVNPRTGAPLQPGDVVEVYRLDEADRAWVQAGAVALTPGPAGLLQATFAVDVLGWWSVGWPCEVCPAPSTLHLVRNGDDGPLGLLFFRPGFFTTTQIPPGVAAFALPPSPVGLRGLVAIYAAGGEARLEAAPCDSTYQVSLPSPPPPPPPPGPTIDAHVVVIPVCPDPDTGVRVQNLPTAVIFFRKSGAPAGTPWRNAGEPVWIFDEEARRLVRGEITLRDVEQGATYTFTTTYQGQSHSRDVQITGPEMTLEEHVEADYCQ